MDEVVRIALEVAGNGASRMTQSAFTDWLATKTWQSGQLFPGG